LESNIGGIWLSDEGNSDVAKDASPNKYDGEIKGAKWVKGKFGHALEFKKGNTVTIPLGKEPMRNKASVIIWIQFIDLGGQQNYFSVWCLTRRGTICFAAGTTNGKWSAVSRL
jgi:hypothetical protein